MAKAENLQSVEVDPEDEADRIVTDAEDAAREADGLLAELENRVERGDLSVSREDLDAATSNRNWLRKLVTGARQRADDLREQKRQSELAKLREEIDAYSLASGEEFSDLLRAFESAAVAFATAFQTRNQKLVAWRDRMKELRVPELNATRIVPPPSEAGLGWGGVSGDVDLQAGGRKFRLLYSGAYLTGALRGLGVERDASNYYFDEKGAGLTIEWVRDKVAQIDHELPPIPDDALFFRAPDGRLIQTSPDHALTREQMKRDKIVQISREEALYG